MTAPILERPLSLYENFFRCRTASRFFNTFELFATYSKPLTKSNLSKALRQLLIDYPILACNVFKEDQEYVMRPIPIIRWEDVFVDKTDSIGLVENGFPTEKGFTWLNTFVFDIYVNSPLFKIVLFDDNNLSVVLDHAIFDGIVSYHFHELLLEYLSKLADDEPVDGNPVLFDYAADKPLLVNSLPPPIDDYLEDWKLDYAYDDPNYFDKWTPPGLTKYPGRYPNQMGLSLAFKHVHFSPEELKTILAKCKAEKVSLTAYIQYIHLFTFRPLFKDHYTVNRLALALRRHFSKEKAPEHYKHFYDDPNYKNLGNLPHLGLTMNYPPLTTIKWDMIRQNTANIVTMVTNKRMLNVSKAFMGSYNPDTDNNEFFEKLLGGPKPETTKLSNLGLIKIPEYDNGWTISTLVFSQDVSAVTSDFMISVISTPKGGLNIVTSYFNHSFEDNGNVNFDQYMADFRQNLLKYAQL